ncbi:hypothetical protein ACFLUD_02410 [Chloroflexota bacterium]
MPSINFMEDKQVQDYYQMWAKSPRTHPTDKEWFYKFVKACLKLDKKLDISYLKLALYDSFHNKYDEKYYDEYTSDIIILFEHLRDFANTTIP